MKLSGNRCAGKEKGKLMAIKVILVEDESGIRMLLKKIIEKKEEFQVVGRMR